MFERCRRTIKREPLSIESHVLPTAVAQCDVRAQSKISTKVVKIWRTSLLWEILGRS